MNKNRFAKWVMAGAGLFFLSSTPRPASAQSVPPAPVQTPRKTLTPARPAKEPSPMDDFAGLTYSDDQKAKIRVIQRDTKSHIDAVMKDDKLGPEQKGAMLQGYQRMERNAMYKVLAPAQQMEVRKKILARRAAAMKEQEQAREKEKQQSPVPVQPPPA